MLPPGKRYAVIREIATPDTIKTFSIINNALNIFIPATVAVCSDWNLWVFTTSFIAFDIVSNIVDWCVFFVIPHWKTTHASLKTAQTRLDIYEKKRQKMFELITDQAGCSGNCEKCWRTYCNYFERGGVQVYDRFIEDEKAYIESELKKLEVQKAELELNKQSKDFTDKKEYLSSASLRLKVLIENEGMDFLQSVYQSIDDLRDTLEKKPVGYTLISDMLYIYTDELLKIVAKLKNLDEEQVNKYMPDIQKIAKYLSRHVGEIEDRIIKLETDDIEVGIAVLLKELSDKKEDRNV